MDRAIKGRLITDSMMLSSATEPWLEAWGTAAGVSDSASCPEQHQALAPTEAPTEASDDALFGMFKPPECVSEDPAMSHPVLGSLRAQCARSLDQQRARGGATDPTSHGLTAPAATPAMQRNLRQRWAWEDACLPLTAFERLLPCESPGEEAVF